MEATQHHGVPTSTCQKCSGIWVSGDSLHRIIRREQNASAIDAALESMFNLDFNESRRNCPSCVDKRLKTVYIENTELDFCVNCKGLYFDHGELDRVYPGQRNESPETSDETTDITSPGSIWGTLKGFFGS